MMQDQLSGLLRRHILETAHEQPAIGHLEAVVAATRAMPQRRPWAVRLRWRLEPVSPFGPLASMRIRLAFAVVALMLLAAVAAAVGGGGPGARTPFEGTWTSTDTLDDSTQTLVVAPGRAPVVHFEDDFSLNCEARGEASTLYLADGQGEIADGRLTVRFPSGGCGFQVPAFVWFYDYVASSDTLLDHDKNTWVRVP